MNAKSENTYRSGNKRLLVSLAIIIVSVLIFSMLPIFPALSISHSNGTELILPLRDNEEFSIRYKHSVNKSPVVDTIRRSGDILIVVSSLFQTYGAGIPILDDNVGTTYEETEDGFLLSGIDSEHDKIFYFTGTYADHHLLYRGDEIKLKAVFGEKQRICLKIKPISLLRMLIS